MGFSASLHGNENRERQPILVAEAIIDGWSKARYWAAAIGKINARVVHKIDETRHPAISTKGIACVDCTTDYIRWLASDVWFGLPRQRAKLGRIRVFELLQYSPLRRFIHSFFG